jgi:quinol-cytochrome oxidoreductase complex cytochrome b subunit
MRTKKFLPLFAGHHPPAELAAYSVMGKKTSFILHLHPEQVPASTLRYTHTFGLGGMTALLILLQITTGILLRFVYVPSPAGAYDSILFLQREVPFGQFVRNIHHLGGVLLIVISFLHLLRVFFTGAFHPPVRSGNWVIGLVMFLLIMSSNFTGYLLPWDQLSYWAVTVVTSMLGYIPVVGPSLTEWVRGGSEVNASTLLTFFNFHTAVIPLTLIILMVFHFWRVRRAGGVIPPRYAGEKDARMADTVPHLVVRELAVALVLLAAIFVLALFLDAPLRERANPAYSPNPAKAPWYFMGIQEMLMHFHPLLGAILLPLAFLTALFRLPWMRYSRKNQGILFYSEKGKKSALMSAVTALLLTTLLILADEYWLHFNLWLPALPSFVSEGIFPLLLYALLFAGYFYLMKKIYVPEPSETVQAVFVFFLVTYTVLSLTGIFFRGPGMMLMWTGML